jgi:hypothetical protein
VVVAETLLLQQRLDMPGPRAVRMAGDPGRPLAVGRADCGRPQRIG